MSSQSGSKSGSGRQVESIDLTTLNLRQLTHFKDELEGDIQFFKEALQNLKVAQTKFQESQESITRCSADDKDKEILVPLTGSMYVPGKLSEPEKVIVDVGTGYYVEKDLDSAKEYFSKKVKYVTEQMEKVQAIGNEKNKVREMVMDIMESKLQQQFAAQQQQKTTAAK